MTSSAPSAPCMRRFPSADAEQGGKATAGRTLWLLRHAKTVTDPPPGGVDFDRVLAPRGRRDATALGRRFAGAGDGLGPALQGVPRPQIALVSPAVRTAATAELVLADMAGYPQCRMEGAIYGADPEEVLTLVRALPDDVNAAMVVGHNPTAQALSQGLLSPRRQEGVLRRDSERLPDLRARRLRVRRRPLG